MILLSILDYIRESVYNLVVRHPLHIIPIAWLTLFGTLVTQSLIKAIKQRNMKHIVDRVIWLLLAIAWFYFTTMMNLSMERMMTQS